jgi:hypothetical protein
MKYIKHFNEEIDPDKYIRAGRELKQLGKIQRGATISDYGSKQKWGLYKVHLADRKNFNSSNIITTNFTDLKCYFHFGDPQWTANNQINSIKSAEDLISEWKEGKSSLSFSLEFRMEPSQQFLIDHQIYAAKLAKTRGSLITGLYENGYHLFSLRLSLSNWADGISEWNYNEDSDVQSRPGDPNWYDALNMYENTKDFNLNLINNWCFYFGIFADRQSARKFKVLLPELIDPHKEKIMELLSELGSDSNDLEEILDMITNISINRLFLTDDEKKNMKSLFIFQS